MVAMVTGIKHVALLMSDPQLISTWVAGGQQWMVGRVRAGDRLETRGLLALCCTGG